MRLDAAQISMQARLSKQVPRFFSIDCSFHSRTVTNLISNKRHFRLLDSSRALAPRVPWAKNDLSMLALLFSNLSHFVNRVHRLDHALPRKSLLLILIHLGEGHLLIIPRRIQPR